MAQQLSMKSVIPQSAPSSSLQSLRTTQGATGFKQVQVQRVSAKPQSGVQPLQMLKPQILKSKPKQLL